MAATRLVEELVARRTDHAHRRHRARRRAAPAVQPDPALRRPRGHPPRRGADAARAGVVRRRTASTSASAPGRCTSTATRREVLLVDGTPVPYDRLVLATGSIPTLPPIRGLVRVDGRLHAKVHAFRSLDDCRGLLAALPGARSAVVVGGGLLGLQVARALGVRGLATEVVEGGEHLLRSQVGAPAGAVLARDLAPARHHRLHRRPGRPADRRRAGPRQRRHRSTPTWSSSRPAAARHRAGPRRRPDRAPRRSSSTTGCAPSTTSTCTPSATAPSTPAAPPASSRPPGSRPGWWPRTCPARTSPTPAAAASPGSAPPASTSPSSATRDARPTGQVVEITNPVVGTHRQLVVRDGVIVGATLVGDLSRVGLITQHFDRGTVLAPGEPGALLLGDRPVPPVQLGRRRRGLRLRRRHRRPDPRLRLARRGPRDHPRHHRLRRLRPRRPPAARQRAARWPPHLPGRNPPVSPHLRKTLVVVGHGMVGHRFVQAAIERGLTETHDIVVDRRGAAGGVRPGRPDLLLRGRRRPALAPARRPVRRPAGPAAPRHRRRGLRPGDPHRPAGRRRGRRVRRAGAGHRAPRRSCRRSPATTWTAASSTGRSRTSRRSGTRRPARRVGAVIGGGLLGPRGRQRARPARPRDPRGRDGAAADGGAGRRRRRGDA